MTDIESDETTFPVTVGPDITYNGNADIFVAKVNRSGTALLYAGYIGGNGRDGGDGIAVDSAGNAYLTGATNSTEATFPVTVGPDLTHNGDRDAFVAKVNASGTALLYAGFIGGSGDEFAPGIAVDGAGNAYVTGNTSSTEANGFPVTVGPDLTHNGERDAFVAKVNPVGAALIYAGYIGGSGGDFGKGIAVDNSGNAYVTGYTSSTDGTFPVTAGPDITHNGNSDAFVAKISNAAPLPPPAANTPPSTPALFFPADGQTGLGTTIIFRWSQATDPDGDRITYDRCLRAGNTNFTTTDCVPVGDSTALINRAFLYAGFGLIGIVLSGWGAIVRRRKIVVVIALLMITGMALVFCSGRSRRGGPTASNEVRSTVSGLRSGTTYFWKIVAKDGHGGAAESTMRKFTTA